jgi:hypothetical protein
MITNSNGTKRLEGTDLVLVDNFNQVFDSLDNTKLKLNNISINQNNQHIFDTSLSQNHNNISINLYLKILSPCTVTLYLTYSDNQIVKTYNILSSEYFQSSGEYSFDPIFFVCDNSAVSLIASSSVQNAALVNCSVVRM